MPLITPLKMKEPGERGINFVDPQGGEPKKITPCSRSAVFFAVSFVFLIFYRINCVDPQERNLQTFNAPGYRL